MPFARAAAELAYFTRAPVSESTAGRLAEAAGAASVAEQTAEVERLERERPPAPAGPPVQQVSADGALVPLVGGEWAGVKTVAIGTVESTVGADGRPAVHAQDLSYFARLADAATFSRLALGELHRRGTATAGVVVAPMDGAEWEQGFLDLHRPDAIRILDFPHAVEHLSAAAQATFGVGTEAGAAWLAAQAHTLQHAGDGAAAVLAALRALPVAAATDPAAAAAARDATVGYVERRLDQMRYAAFRAQGYPIGSGSVESANKLVVEARLKGSGMRWARAHVNPLVALRTVACAERWAEAWPHIEQQLRAQARQQGRPRQQARRAARPPARPSAPPRRCPAPRPAPPARPPRIVDGRPTAEHPWKKRPLLAGGRRALAAHLAPAGPKL
jgi:hypothetical protein